MTTRRAERRFETVLIEADKAPNISVLCKLVIEKIRRKELIPIDKREIQRSSDGNS
jgi:hypothetical protein